MLTAPEPEEDLYMYVSLGVGTCCECCTTERLGCATAYILYRQDLGRCRDKVLAFGEVGVGISSCHKEATPLLSSSYCLRINQVSFTIIVKEI